MKLRTATFLGTLIALGGLASSVQAQTIYRIVGPDGKVTFSDKPPISAEQGKIATTGTGAAAAAGGGLPYELRQVANKYPVTIYTAPECAPCNSGRALLAGRGVPFTERTITTAEDTAALQRLTGENSLPVMAVGGQRVKGFSDVEWSQYLDAAGYPKASALPSNYKNPPPSPLVAVQKPADASAEPQEKKPAANNEYRPPAGPAPSNPAGITF
jgi:glutaredoxin